MVMHNRISLRSYREPCSSWMIFPQNTTDSHPFLSKSDVIYSSRRRVIVHGNFERASKGSTFDTTEASSLSPCSKLLAQVQSSTYRFRPAVMSRLLK